MAVAYKVGARKLENDYFAFMWSLLQTIYNRSKKSGGFSSGFKIIVGKTKVSRVLDDNDLVSLVDVDKLAIDTKRHELLVGAFW